MVSAELRRGKFAGVYAPGAPSTRPAPSTDRTVLPNLINGSDTAKPAIVAGIYTIAYIARRNLPQIARRAGLLSLRRWPPPAASSQIVRVNVAAPNARI